MPFELLALCGLIHFLVGKPRNGKSLRAMMYVFEELTTTNRYIVTNLVLFLDDLQLLLIKRGFGHIDVRKRVRMLTDAETKNFWLIRAGGLVLDRPPGYDDKTGSDVDYSPCFELQDEQNRGVCYLIDEVHTHWRARGWSGTPRHVDFYNSQHGKLGDRVFFITQNTKLVDQNFIRLAQDFGYCRNHRLEKHGRFRGDNKFTMHVYPGPVSNDREVTLNVETFHLDQELADCYDTSAGVGMPGGGKADAGFRAKGLPLKTVWIGLAAALVFVWVFFSWGLPKITDRFLKPVIGPAQTAKAMQPASPVRVDAPSALPVPVPARVPDAQPSRPLMVTGILHHRNKFTVTLSDGQVITEADRRISGIDRRGVILDGRLVPRKPSEPRPASTPPARPQSAAPVSQDVAPSVSAQTDPAPSSAWRRDPDGVQRLKQPLTW